MTTKDETVQKTTEKDEMHTEDEKGRKRRKRTKKDEERAKDERA